MKRICTFNNLLHIIKFLILNKASNTIQFVIEIVIKYAIILKYLKKLITKLTQYNVCGPT